MQASLKTIRWTSNGGYYDPAVAATFAERERIAEYRGPREPLVCWPSIAPGFLICRSTREGWPGRYFKEAGRIWHICQADDAAEAAALLAIGYQRIPGLVVVPDPRHRR